MHNRDIDGWRLVAAIEIADQEPLLHDLLHLCSSPFELQPAPASPPGYRWYNLCIAQELPPERAFALTGALLRAMSERAVQGSIGDFRIISGQHWLDVQAAWNDSDDELFLTTPQPPLRTGIGSR
jgi:hypothetical protein